jgi:GNAT superfamily N-acetyltransferase
VKSVKLQIVLDATISPAQDAAVRAGLCVCFPPDRDVFCRTRAWHGSRPAWSVLVTCEDAVVAHAGIVQRQILAGQERVWIAGIQNVFVLPEHRGLGLFRQVMSAALEEARQRGLDFGLLFCGPDIGRKYARQGWQLLEGRSVTRIDEQGFLRPLPPKNVTLFYPLAATKAGSAFASCLSGPSRSVRPRGRRAVEPSLVSDQSFL